MQSLKRLEQNNAVESGEVAYRLRKAQTQLQRSVALAKEGYAALPWRVFSLPLPQCQLVGIH